MMMTTDGYLDLDGWSTSNKQTYVYAARALTV
jgi:hypothetical protein